MIAAIPCHTSKRTAKKLLGKTKYLSENAKTEDLEINYKRPTMTIGTVESVYPYQQKCYIKKFKKDKNHKSCVEDCFDDNRDLSYGNTIKYGNYPHVINVKVSITLVLINAVSLVIRCSYE